MSPQSNTKYRSAITRKMVPITKVSELIPCIFCMYVLRGWSFQKQNSKEEEYGETEQQQTYQFT